MLPIFIDAALKGAILVIVAAAAAYALRNRSAASRHAVWTAAVIGHLAIPALVFILPAWRMPVLPATPWMSQSAPASSPTAAPYVRNEIASASRASGPVAPAPEAQTAASKQATGPGAGLTAGETPASTGKTATRFSTIAIVAAIWFLGAVLVLLRLAIGTWKVGQLARDGARVEEGVWLSLTQRLANRLGVTRPLTLLRGESLAVPVTWGIVYPAVLLPQDSETWTEERRRFVLVHEMAHVKRFDALTQLLSQVVVALFWFDPLVWIAAHQMRVEREHACDDYVLRDGTTPSLYAGELLEMVRSIGTPRHDRAAPAFAALAMARRSEFEGRMLAILDPRLDRQTLPRRGTLMTAVIVALLALPLAALRPFQEPARAAAADDLPSSFKVSILPATSGGATLSIKEATGAAASQSASAATKPIQRTSYSCDTFTPTQHGTSNHVEVGTSNGDEILRYISSNGNRCAEATVVGAAKFSADEKHLAQLSSGGFARFRERTAMEDRAVSAVPVGDGSISYTASLNGRTVPFDGSMQAWFERFLPQVLREAGINVPERVARIRSQGGVPAVLKEIGQISSTSAKAEHYRALIKGGLSAQDAERVAGQVGQDLAGSSGDLSSVLQMLPRSIVQSPSVRQGIMTALSHITSSGDKANTLEILAPNADPELLIILAQAAETLPSSGDKANFLSTTTSEYLTPGNEALRNAFFHAVSTIQSSGDMANVLMGSVPYSHANPQVASQIIETSKRVVSSGDAANVLLSLVSQRALNERDTRSVLSAIQRTLTMESSGDRANVLMAMANAKLLSTREVKDAFTKAAMALPSDGDRSNVLAAAANAQ